MIKNLYIKDFALIESASIDFSDGLNVIIGETGSGKSMLIDALILAFGGRASSELVRNGANKSIIELHLKCNDFRIKDILSENDIDYNDEHTILRREISAKGNTRNFVNDSPVTTAILKQIGDIFIDFHGQHDHQSLLNSANHANIFDKSANIDDFMLDYTEKYEILKNTISKYKSLIAKESKLKDKSEIQRFKLDEINKVNPTENEDEILEAELKLLENSELLFSLSSELYSELYDSDVSAWNILSKSSIVLKQLSKIDSSFTEYFNELESAIITIKEIASFSNNYHNGIEFNPERIEQIRLRLLQLKGLQKKFGTIQEILKLKNEIIADLQLVENFDDEIKKLKSEIHEQKEQLFKSALILESKRREYITSFSDSIIEGLANLGINNSKFEVRLDRQFLNSDELTSLCFNANGETCEFLPNGINKIEFFISTNLGESVKPLKQVASGGEVSRIMLSIKNILAEKDNISCLVFDEIDTGVSGRIAQKVGIAMNKLAIYHQILAISHLPQIAAAAKQIILVEKFEEESKTFSLTKLLNKDEKVIEIAKMMSGSQVSEASVNNAIELIKSINN